MWDVRARVRETLRRVRVIRDAHAATTNACVATTGLSAYRIAFTAMNESSRPSAQGSLAKTPFAHLILYLYQRRASGTLIVQALAAGARSETKVLFHRGRAVAAHLAQPAAALDQGLLPLCAALDGQFAFHESDLVGSGPSIATGMFDPLAFVAEAARRHVRPDVVDEVIGKFAHATLALQPAMDLSRLSLTEDEARFAEPLSRGPVTIAGLCEAGELEPAAARRLVYVLLITKVAGVYDASAADGFRRSPPPDTSSTPAAAASSSLPAAPPTRAPSDRGRNSGAAWRAIAARAAEMATNRSAPGSGPPMSRAPTPPPAEPSTPASEPAVRRPSRPQSSSLLTPQTPQPSAAEIRPPKRTVTQPLNLQPQAAPHEATPTPASRPTSRPVTSDSRPASRPLTPAPAPKVLTPAPSPRPVSRPITPAPGHRPPSRPLTPVRFSQDSGGSQPISRPLTPANFASTPSPLPRVTPSAPISRVTPRPSQPAVETLDSSGKFKRVDQLCQRNAYEEALPIIRALVEEDRKNAKYLGMLAHVLLGRATDSQIGKEIVETVNQALRIDTDEVRALYTKARCYKRMGKEREALHYFKRTVAVEPNHLDATREIRLLMLRLSEKRKR
jgi:hypothetical protein